MVLDPREPSEVKVTAGARDGYVRETCVGRIHGFWDRAAQVIELVGVRGRREVIGDLDLGPFSTFGLVSGGDGDIGLALIGESGRRYGSGT